MHEKKKIPLWHYKQFSNNMCPKCLNAASKAIIVSFSTSSSQVFLVNIHKSKSMRSTETSKDKNGCDWKKERLAWPWRTKNKAGLGDEEEKMRVREKQWMKREKENERGREKQ